MSTSLFPIDLRSDTVTKPGEVMRILMSEAEVGDDVYGEDPTVLRLEETAAELLHKEAALFVTSGTQGNLVSLLTHCSRGDGVILGKGSHILCNEGGGLSALGGLVPIPVDDTGGLPSVAELDAVLPNDDNVHLARATLLCLENTHNKWGGHASSPLEIAKVAYWAHRHDLKVHMDGARLFNAASAHEISPWEFVKDVDSVQICLSKGLGAPMGSLICASSDFIREARFWRKKLGGGLRQAGIVAAAGLYALTMGAARLPDDHGNALLIIMGLKEAGVPILNLAAHPTNMVYFSAPDKRLADELHSACKKRGVLFGKASATSFRLVTHLDISIERAVTAGKIIGEEYRAVCL